MNCQTFSELVSDITRDQMMDATARTQALAHADECLSCARELKNESRLTSELRELVSETKDWTASSPVWENLSAAFDARNVTPSVSVARPSGRASLLDTPLLTRGLTRYYAAAAIAAMLLLAFTIFLIKRQSQPIARTERSIPASSVSEPQENSSASKEKQIAKVIATLNKKPRFNQPRYPITSRKSAGQLNQPKEIVTDFIQLTYGDPGAGGDAQIVRMELPRSAMASFGLPVNMDRADQRVKADVLLGADGLAHAIRFVQ